MSKRPAVDLFADLEGQYGADGSGMNFGAILMPVITEAKARLGRDVELTDRDLFEVLGAMSNFPFVDKARRDRDAAVTEIVNLVKRLATH